MDLTTLIGILLSVILMAYGIGLDKLSNFVDTQSLLIVFGGTLAAVVASYPFTILKDIPKHFRVLFRGKIYNIPQLVDQLVDLSMIARQSGLLALEDKANEISDSFLRHSVLMIVDANDPDKVRLVLERELENMMVRHDQAAGLYEKAASYAPAFGMIGTLIGLVNMLKGLDLSANAGSSSIGQDMSVALITTFYGCVLANAVFNPIAKKLRIRQDEEELYCSTIIEGILSIQAGENPQYLRERLLTSVKRSQQQKLLARAETSDTGYEEDKEE